MNVKDMPTSALVLERGNKSLALREGDAAAGRELAEIEAEIERRVLEDERAKLAEEAIARREREAAEAAARADRERKERQSAKLRRKLHRHAEAFDAALSALVARTEDVIGTYAELEGLGQGHGARYMDPKRRIPETVAVRLKSILPHADFATLGPSYAASAGFDKPLAEQLGGDA